MSTNDKLDEIKKQIEKLGIKEFIKQNSVEPVSNVNEFLIGKTIFLEGALDFDNNPIPIKVEKIVNAYNRAMVIVNDIYVATHKELSEQAKLNNNVEVIKNVKVEVK